MSKVVGSSFGMDSGENIRSDLTFQTPIWMAVINLARKVGSKLDIRAGRRR